MWTVESQFFPTCPHVHLGILLLVIPAYSQSSSTFFPGLHPCGSPGGPQTWRSPPAPASQGLGLLTWVPAGSFSSYFLTPPHPPCRESYVREKTWRLPSCVHFQPLPCKQSTNSLWHGCLFCCLLGLETVYERVTVRGSKSPGSGNTVGCPGSLKMSIRDIISTYNNYIQIINKIYYNIIFSFWNFS